MIDFELIILVTYNRLRDRESCMWEMLSIAILYPFFKVKPLLLNWKPEKALVEICMHILPKYIDFVSFGPPKQHNPVLNVLENYDHTAFANRKLPKAGFSINLLL